ncbi:MAG: stage III sporulation protein AB [Defluviitaleaceae bacterium]|nr:stage III sporulation protein AB [Defluviitaleaceae bacterium]MCL2274636.1 stage III sporulation protein AB [Defluviitaleaceae bacterium]
MLVRLIGAMVVIGASCALGFHYAAQETQRVKDLLSLKKALLILASEIEYMRTALPAASLNIGKRVGGWVGEMFTHFGEKLASSEGETTYQLWAQVLSAAKENAQLADEDWRVVEDFGKTLGYLDITMQKNAINYAVEYIDEKAASLQIQADKNKKMYRSLGVICGLLLAVVMW